MAAVPILVWFRQDLRLADQRALSAALATGRPVLPVYILDDAAAGSWKRGAASRWWLHHSLTSLAKDLSDLGAPLILRRGATALHLAELTAATGATAVGSKASVTGPEGLTGDITIVAGEELGIGRYPDPQLAGLYRLALPGKKPSLFAVNVPETAPGGGSESDLTRLDLQSLKDLNPAIAVAADPADLKFITSEAGPSVFSPRPWGPTLARWLLTITLVVWLVELFYAWWIGPSRAAVSTD